jgi:hypothetical protein
VPNKIYIAVTIALVALSSFVTARIVGSRGSEQAGHRLAFKVEMQCDSWARELDKAAEAYEAHARAPIEKPDLPFGVTHFERHVAGARIHSEQKFCRFVRGLESPDPGTNEIDDATSAFTSTGADPNQLAKAMRSLAEGAKRTTVLEIRP